MYRLDRLGRSLKHLIELIDSFTNMEVGIVSLNALIDTTSPHGRLITNVFASMAKFEREFIIERIKAGLSAAKTRGRKGERPEGISSLLITHNHTKPLIKKHNNVLCTKKVDKQCIE